MDLSIAELQLMERGLNVRFAELVERLRQAPDERTKEELAVTSALLDRIGEELERHDMKKGYMQGDT